jgi:hypothetical protein
VTERASPASHSPTSPNPRISVPRGPGYALERFQRVQCPFEPISNNAGLSLSRDGMGQGSSLRPEMLPMYARGPLPLSTLGGNRRYACPATTGHYVASSLARANTSSRPGAVLAFYYWDCRDRSPTTRRHRCRTLKTGLWLYVRRKTGRGVGLVTRRQTLPMRLLPALRPNRWA